MAQALRRDTPASRRRRTETWILGGLLACPLTGIGPALGSQEQRYTILRGDTEVGVHEVRREVANGQTRVKSSSRIDVRLLGLAVYRFRYEAEELWDQAGLARLEVRVDDDSVPFRLRGERSGEAFAWTSDAGEGRYAKPLFPTNHWNDEVLLQDRVLNTLTGRLNRVDITRAGNETLDLPSGQVKAVRYRYRGDLDLDSWYDDQGQWLGMRFEGRDGSEIRYLCATCRTVAQP